MKPIQVLVSIAGLALASSLVGCSSDTTSDYAAGGGSGSGTLDAAFSASVVQIIQGDSIVFTDKSTGVITEREWDFDGDGSIDSTAKNPTWTPQLDTGSGDKSFTVTLSLNGGAAVETKDDYIEVLALPEASFTIDVLTNPVGPEGVFYIENTSTNADVFEWNFAGGTPLDGWEDAVGGEVVFTLIGHKSISLVAKRDIFSSCDDCGDTFSKDITVQPAPDFSASGGHTNTRGFIQGGMPLIVTFKNESNPLDHPDVKYNWDFEGTGLFTDDGVYGDANSPRTHWYTQEGLYTVRIKAETDTLGSPIKTIDEFILVVGDLADGSFEDQVLAQEPGQPWEPFYGPLDGHHLIRPADSGLSESDGPMPSAGDAWLEVSTESTHNANPPPEGTREGGLEDIPVPTGEVDPSSRGAAGVRQEFAYAVDEAGFDIDLLSLDATFVLGDAVTDHLDWMSVDVSFEGETYNLFYRDANSVEELTEESQIHLDSDDAVAPMTLMKRVAVKLKSLFSEQDIQTGDKVTLWVMVGNVGNDLDGAPPSWGYVDNATLKTEAGTLDVDFSASNVKPSCYEEIEFTDVTFQGPDDPPQGTSWFWNFGDGGTNVDEQHPTYAYDTPGTYTVRLTVISPEASGTKEKVGFIDVSGPEAVGAVVGPGMWGSPKVVTFENQSMGAQSYTWNFKDSSNNQDAIINVTHNNDVNHTYWWPAGDYADLDGNGDPDTTYYVELTAWSGQDWTGCSSTMTIPIDIRQGFRAVYFRADAPLAGPSDVVGSLNSVGLMGCTSCHRSTGNAPNFTGDATDRNTWKAAENFYATVAGGSSTFCPDWSLVTVESDPEPEAYKDNSLVYRLVNENEPGGDSDNPCGLDAMPKSGQKWDTDSARYKALIQWLSGGAQKGQIKLDTN